MYFQNVEIFKWNGKENQAENDLADTSETLKKTYLKIKGEKKLKGGPTGKKQEKLFWMLQNLNAILMVEALSLAV